MRTSIRAAFYRGGTSKAVVFNAADLPADRALQDQIFLEALGSPDPYGRQLNGMGGGLSSLSKVVVVAPSQRDDADVDYTFVQIAVDAAVADYGSACGNMSSCVGPFALEEGMVAVAPRDTEAKVRIFNTNTGQIYHATFPVQNGAPVETGDFAIPGVAGSGARVAVDFLSPAGAVTGALLPSGNARDWLEVPGVGRIEVSLVDATNPVVFARAHDMGCPATGRPMALDGDPALMDRMEALRRVGAVAMGLAQTPSDTARANPKVAVLSGPAPFVALDGSTHAPEGHDINLRLISMGNFHRAVTLTGAMCTAVAAQIPGSLIHEFARTTGQELRIGTPSGVLPASAHVDVSPGAITAVSAGTFRTQRRLMEGRVLVPTARLNLAKVAPQ